MLVLENTFTIRLLFLAAFIFLVVERVHNTFVKQVAPSKPKKVFHRWFFFLLLGSYLGIVCVAFFSFWRAKGLYILPSLVGVALMGCGIFFRREAIRGLDKYWSVYIEVKEDQRIVRKGIFRYLKHPYYTGVVLELAGFSLLTNSVWGVLLTFMLQLPLVLIRVHYENRVLNVYGKRMGFSR